MTKEKRVKDLMLAIEDYSFVQTGSTLREALNIMLKSFCKLEGLPCTGHRTVLVYDGSKAVGILTFRAILETIEPKFLKVAYEVPAFFEGLFSAQCRHEANRTVKEVMFPLSGVFVQPEDTIVKAIHIMLKHRLGSLPVLTNDKVVGMVRSGEIFNEIAFLIINNLDENKSAV